MKTSTMRTAIVSLAAVAVMAVGATAFAGKGMEIRTMIVDMGATATMAAGRLCIWANEHEPHAGAA